MKIRQVPPVALILATLFLPLLADATRAQEGTDRPILRFAGDAGDIQSLDPHYAVGGLERVRDFAPPGR